MHNIYYLISYCIVLTRLYDYMTEYVIMPIIYILDVFQVEKGDMSQVVMT